MIFIAMTLFMIVIIGVVLNLLATIFRKSESETEDSSETEGIPAWIALFNIVVASVLGSMIISQYSNIILGAVVSLLSFGFLIILSGVFLSKRT